MKNNLLAKILYIALQGVFLPLLLWLDDLRSSGPFVSYILVFILWEVLVTLDALLYWVVFRGEK